MPLTREERDVIQQLGYRLRKLEEEKLEVDTKLKIIEEFIKAQESTTDMAFWTHDEWVSFLKDKVFELIEIGPVKGHNHLKATSGGPCFAKKGANLVDRVV